MKKATGFYPRVQVDTSASGSVGQAGGVLLTDVVAVTGLGRELTAALAPWRKPLAAHDPAKVVTDLAVTLALGGDCLADVALLRAEPGVYRPVASDLGALLRPAPSAVQPMTSSGPASGVSTSKPST